MPPVRIHRLGMILGWCDWYRAKNAMSSSPVHQPWMVRLVSCKRTDEVRI